MSAANCTFRVPFGISTPGYFCGACGGNRYVPSALQYQPCVGTCSSDLRSALKSEDPYSLTGRFNICCSEGVSV